MFKMLRVKRIITVGGGLFILLSLLFGSDVYSYLTTTYGLARNTVKDSIPVQFEIERARDMVADLTPEIRRASELVAREEIAVENLRERIDTNQESLAQAERDIRQLQADLDGSASRNHFVYAGVSYSEDQVRADLATRFARFQAQDATLKTLEQTLRAREQGLAAAREKVQVMVDTKRQLEVQIAEIEARHKMVEVAEASSAITIDESQLSKCRDLIDSIQARIEVSERMLATQATDEIKLDDDVPVNLTEQINDYFDNR